MRDLSREDFSCQLKVPLSLLCRYCSDDGSAGEKPREGSKKYSVCLGWRKLIAALNAIMVLMRNSLVESTVSA